MARRYGRAPRGERCRVGVPQGHWKTTTITAALRASGLVATTMFDGATNGERFRTYVTEILIPTLRPGDTVILDNLPAHKVTGVRKAAFNPIEQAFAELKALLGSAAARTATNLRQAIRQALAAFTPDKCRNYLAAAGYDAFYPARSAPALGGPATSSKSDVYS